MMDSSGNIKKRKNCEEKETSSIEMSSLSNEGLQHLSNLQKKESGESSQDSRDNKRVTTEPKAGTSSATEIIVQPVCTKAGCSHASILKSHCFDPKISSEKPKQTANTQEDDAYASTDSRDQIPLTTIYDALEQKYDLMFESVKSSLMKNVRRDENHKLWWPITDFFENKEGANLETIETMVEFIAASVSTTSVDQQYLDGLDEHYSERKINQVVAILIKRLRYILTDMDRLHKVMEKEPFWKPLLKKGCYACCYDAGRSLRYKINDRIIKNTFDKWPDIKVRLSLLFEYLNKAFFVGFNLTEHKDRMIFMNCAREMILFVLIKGGLLEISGNFGELLVTYPSDNMEFVIDVKNQLDSIYTRLISFVGYVERLQEVTQK